ncbi:hypothetical protein W97_05158 [Coniosporium apollinis CBS 100218]|uniref:Uncharacterized protein n=1 Tax=Coniosporium apollinis (strain CBS 100218) TaxID=1168221 RepID=R7YW56_CONA1|nr:uncharacterized protein W97_05158 [Coniosporium apollinis CBS 100218]EON65916.1 hypothetical protein W97_05158 [Coniosporium apollinis CBS 100218]
MPAPFNAQPDQESYPLNIKSDDSDVARHAGPDLIAQITEDVRKKVIESLHTSGSLRPETAAPKHDSERGKSTSGAGVAEIRESDADLRDLWASRRVQRLEAELEQAKQESAAEKEARLDLEVKHSGVMEEKARLVEAIASFVHGFHSVIDSTNAAHRVLANAYSMLSADSVEAITSRMDEITAANGAAGKCLKDTEV